MADVAGTCESCGREDGDLEPVHRVYVLVADDGSEDVRVESDQEEWCASCRGTYPHRPT